MHPQIVLASASPRRAELLNQIGVRHVVEVVDIDETPWLEEQPLQYVQRVAAEKSAVCCARTQHPLPVLAADTAVVLDGRIMGKPTDYDEAFAMLQRLSGQTHAVYSAVSLRGREHWQALSVTEVTFRHLSNDEIRAYWQSGEPHDKAGAYAIQGVAGVFVESIKGSYSGVVGLPLFETAQLLAKQGIRVIV